MLDPNMKPLPWTEQASENLEKAIDKVIMSMIESGEAFAVLESDKAS